MKYSTSIKFKAAFLLVVFALNTIVGFACSIGMDMDFNSRHHQQANASEPVVHIHADGKRHVHNARKESEGDEKLLPENEARKTVVHVHKDGKRHVHGEMKESQTDDRSHNSVGKNLNQEQKSDKGNCCSDEVRDFEQLDKSVPHNVKIVYPTFLTTFVGTYYEINLLPSEDFVKDIKQFVRSYHPPIPDIRIAIQSFQI